jgi:superfamily I DNA/RNA helicase
LGRKTRLSEALRTKYWEIAQLARTQLLQQGMITWSALFHQLAAVLTANKHPPFDFVVVDEAQDISIAQLRFVAAITGDKPDGLFFAGDLGQRIFQQPFYWKALGVDVRGRSRTLKINYRTSHQIRMQADRLLASEIADVDGNSEDRSKTISVFNGEKPEIRVFDDQEQEAQHVAQWLKARFAEGLEANEAGIFVRSAAELDRATHAAELAGCAYKILDENFELAHGSLIISTMHLAKGLEFRAVAIMACDDEIIPLQERVETITDEADLVQHHL